jgi:signal transduction histidine kinase
MTMKTIIFSGKKAGILLGFTLLFNISLSGQNKIDSLENLLKTTSLTVVEKFNLYQDLSVACLDVNLSKAILYAHEGVVLAEKENDKLMTSVMYKILGTAYLSSLQFDTAKHYLNKALEYAHEAQDEAQEISVYAAMGNWNFYQSSYPDALECYLRVLSYHEKSKNEMEAAKIKLNIAAVYENTGNHEKALEYLHQLEAVARKYDSKPELGKALSNMASIYGTDAYNEWDKALQYAEEAYAIFESLGNLRNLSILTQRFVVIYTYHKNDYQKALEWATKGLLIAEEMGSDSQAAFSLTQMAMIYFRMSNCKEAIRFGSMAFQRDTSDHITRSVLDGMMALCHAYLHNMDSAYFYLNSYYTVLMWGVQQDYQQSLAEMEIQYETEKKEMKIAAMEGEKELYILLSISIGIVLILALIVFIIRQRLAVHKRKLAEQQIALLKQENQLIATQSIMDGETAERIRLSKDLHDGLGGMLSTIKLNLYGVKQGAVIEGNDLQNFEKALTLLNSSIIELRRIAHNMMPESLTRFGLRASLEDFCASIPNAEFHYFGSGDRIESKLEIMLYRTVYELINNALKHSGAEHILVQIVQEDDRIALTVQDNGCGFNANAPTKGTGLNNIRDRVTSCNGQISIWSEPEKGTEINIEL